MPMQCHKCHRNIESDSTYCGFCGTKVKNNNNRNNPIAGQLLTQADRLIPAAKANAVAMSITLLDKFPIFAKIKPEHADFVLTIAGVFIAAERLKEIATNSEQTEQLLAVISDRLSQWRDDSIFALDDCQTLFHSEVNRLSKAGWESKFLTSDAIGIWIVFNLLGHTPKDDECELVRATGVIITHSFFNWWD